MNLLIALTYIHQVKDFVKLKKIIINLFMFLNIQIL